ncbi:MAG: lysostaphin resistance A-like protein [Planctomycetota bacterium]
MLIAEIENSLTSLAELLDIVFCLTGLICLGFWLLRTSWGRKSLINSKRRINTMPFYLPFLPLLIYMISISSALVAVERAYPDLPDWQHEFIQNAILCAGTLLCIALIIYLAKVNFTDGLKGFGFNPKQIHKDFVAAAVNLVSIWPIIVVILALTVYMGEYFQGTEFDFGRHRELQSISIYPQLKVRVLIFITAAFIVPVFEELLFRGLFQTIVRSALERLTFLERFKDKSIVTWSAIIITSVFFVAAHEDRWHLPALFVLSLGMGYAYEKSGSLMRPIFIHIFFNSLALASVLLDG